MVDDAIRLAQAICSTSPDAMCLTLLPQWHSSVEQTTIVKRRRLVEDLMLTCCAKFPLLSSQR